MLPGSVLEVLLPVPPASGSSLQIPLFGYSFSVGNFSTVRAVVQYDSCSVATQLQVAYGSSSATALVAIDSSNCVQPLSTGAIVGIAVGCVIAGAAVAVAIVLVHRAMTAHHTVTANAAISANEISLLQHKTLSPAS